MTQSGHLQRSMPAPAGQLWPKPPTCVFFCFLFLLSFSAFFFCFLFLLSFSGCGKDSEERWTRRRIRRWAIFEGRSLSPVYGSYFPSVRQLCSAPFSLSGGKSIKKRLPSLRRCGRKPAKSFTPVKTSKRDSRSGSRSEGCSKDRSGGTADIWRRTGPQIGCTGKRSRFVQSF